LAANIRDQGFLNRSGIESLAICVLADENQELEKRNHMTAAVIRRIRSRKYVIRAGANWKNQTIPADFIFPSLPTKVT